MKQSIWQYTIPVILAGIHHYVYSIICRCKVGMQTFSSLPYLYAWTMRTSSLGQEVIQDAYPMALSLKSKPFQAFCKMCPLALEKVKWEALF